MNSFKYVPSPHHHKFFAIGEKLLAWIDKAGLVIQSRDSHAQRCKLDRAIHIGAAACRGCQVYEACQGYDQHGIDRRQESVQKLATA